MSLRPNPLKQALRNKEKQIGLWVSLCSGFAANVVAPADYDWFLIDMEHSPNDLGSVIDQLQVFDRRSATAIVRVPWNEHVMVKRLLDSGAQALLFPMVQSVDEAKAAVAATRYPPRGIRGVAGVVRATDFGRITDYFERVEDETMVLVQLETKAALDAGVEIGTVDGVDGVFFGPADIGADIGFVGQPMHPAVWDLIGPTAERLIEAGVPVGTIVTDLVFATELLNSGFTFVACANDTGLLAEAADAAVATVRAGLA